MSALSGAAARRPARRHSAPIDDRNESTHVTRISKCVRNPARVAARVCAAALTNSIPLLQSGRTRSDAVAKLPRRRPAPRHHADNNVKTLSHVDATKGLQRMVDGQQNDDDAQSYCKVPRRLPAGRLGHVDRERLRWNEGPGPGDGRRGRRPGREENFFTHPLLPPVALDACDVSFEEQELALEVTCADAIDDDRTGVEMEALSGASISGTRRLRHQGLPAHRDKSGGPATHRKDGARHDMHLATFTWAAAHHRRGA